MSKRILVTGVNSTVAHSIIKALRSSGLDLEIFGCDINPYSPGLYRVHHAFLVKPFSDPDYEEQMLALLQSQRIDVLLPAVEAEMQSLAERKDFWEKRTGTLIPISPKSLLDITQDKYRTALFLEKNECSFPESTVDLSPAGIERLVEKVGFPLIVKPRRGSASRHVYLVSSLEELRDRLRLVPDAVIQEHLDSEEYTCGAFMDAQGKLKGIAVLQRGIGNGVTMTAIADSFPEVEAEVEKIVSALKPVGSCNVQLRINKKGKPTAFEINARFSSSVAIRAHFGFNEVEATLRSFLFGEEIKALSLRKGVAMRYFNEVYIEREEMDNILVRGESRPFSKIEEHF